MLIGVRDNGRLVQAFGVNLARTRLAAFAISGFIAGLAGALFAYHNAGGRRRRASRRSGRSALFAIGGDRRARLAARRLLGAVFVVGIPFLLRRRHELIDLLTCGVGLLLLLCSCPAAWPRASTGSATVPALGRRRARHPCAEPGRRLARRRDDEDGTLDDRGIDAPLDAEVEPSGVEHEHGARRERERLDGVTGGEAVVPLAVLFGLNLVDELDQVAFGVVAPEIRDTFGVSETGDHRRIGVVAGGARASCSPCPSASWPTATTACGWSRSRPLRVGRR